MSNSDLTTQGLRTKGYRMPAEWENQYAIWLAWPHNQDTFEEFLPDVEKVFLRFIELLSPDQFVNLLVLDDDMEIDVRERLTKTNANIENVIFHQIENHDVWIRDYGPTFLKATSPENPYPNAMINWMFNAWGGKYDDLALDTQIPPKMQKYLEIPMFSPNFILEGGSIDVNGTGLLLTSEQCLLNSNRNPSCSKTEIEQILAEYLNISHVIWLKEGIMGDDTDGHIDDIARFVSPNQIVYVLEDNPEDENFSLLKENLAILEDYKEKLLQSGVCDHLDLIPLPMPDPVIIEDTRLPASYANFYIGNKTVVVPIFGCDKDELALKQLQSLFSNREVVGINCRSLVYGLGTLHCSSQQQPK